MPNQRHSRCRHGTILRDSWQDCPRCWDAHIRDKATWTTEDKASRRALFPEEFAQQSRAEKPYAPPPVPPVLQPSPQAKGTIEGIWAEYNVDEDSKAGLRIHVRFSVENMKGAECSLVAYFYFANGEKMRDTNGAFRTTNGGIAVSQKFTPPYQNMSYSDHPLFMPNEELHVSGTHNNPGGKKTVNLGFMVTLWSWPSHRQLVASALQLFNYNL